MPPFAANSSSASLLRSIFRRFRRPGSIETNFDASQSLAANAQTLAPGAARDSTVRWVWLLLLAHLVIWTVTPTLANRNLSLDSVEMWVWGN